MKNITDEKKFGGVDLKKEYALFKNSSVVILPCPYEGTVTSQKGCSKGPAAILDASNNMELFDDELKVETCKIGIFTREPLALERLSPPEVINRIKSETHDVFNSGKLAVLLGGEHSITIGAVRAARDMFKDVSVLYLDAHYDLRDNYNGSPYNHACAARRVLECSSLVQVGVRSLSTEEGEFIKKPPVNLKIISIYDMIKNADWRKDVISGLSGDVYVSIDLDVFDPSLMPSVGTPEPGGMLWHDVCDLLRVVSEKKKIIGFDVVELMPIKGFTAPDFTAAKLIYRFLSYIFFIKGTIPRPA